MAGEAHIRIDEGVKRGPRKPYAKRQTNIVHRDIAGRIAASIPADQDPAPILAQYLTEARTSDIAAQYGVTRPALNMWLLDRAEDAWKKAQVARALSRKESAEDDLEDAADPLTLARAREKFRAVAWRAEREFPARWGSKTEIKQEVTHKLQLDDAELARRVASLMQSRGLIIEGSAETVVDQQVITAQST